MPRSSLFHWLISWEIPPSFLFKGHTKWKAWPFFVAVKLLVWSGWLILIQMEKFCFNVYSEQRHSGRFLSSLMPSVLSVCAELQFISGRWWSKNDFSYKHSNPLFSLHVPLHFFFVLCFSLKKKKNHFNGRFFWGVFYITSPTGVDFVVIGLKAMKEGNKNTHGFQHSNLEYWIKKTSNSWNM